MVSVSDLHVGGLTFEDSKQYLLGKVFSGQETLQCESKSRTLN